MGDIPRRLRDILFAENAVFFEVLYGVNEQRGSAAPSL
jgi:hypothetical protein